MHSKSIHKTSSPEETAALAIELAAELRGQKILLFGDLGSGKTTFLRALGVSLGVQEKVKSPTFVYEKNYELLTGEQFVHLDLYRLDTIPAEMVERLTELFVSSNTVAVEWAERLSPDQLPTERIEIYFKESGGADKREISVLSF